MSRLCLVTPSYQYARFLPACLDAIHNQPGFAGVDHVVMDGGSTDGSRDIIAARAERLHYWQSEPDGGLYRAIETGFRHSDAEIMGWVNADDLLTPWAIQSVLRIFDTLPQVQWLTTQFPLTADAEGMVYNTGLMPGCDRWGFLRGENAPTLGRTATHFIAQESTFWRRSLWDAAGGGFDHSLTLACDFELWARFLALAEPHVLPAPLGIYRLHGANMALTGIDRYRDECATVLARYPEFDNTNPNDLKLHVVFKKMKVAGLRDMLDPARAPKLTLVRFNEYTQRHEVSEA